LVPKGGVNLTHVGQSYCLMVTSPDGAVQRQCLGKVIQRLLLLPEGGINLPYVAQGDGLGGTIAHRAEHRQRLRIVFQSFLLLPQIEVISSDVVQSCSLTVA